IRFTIPVRLNQGYMLFRKQYEIFLKNSLDYIQQYWKNRMTLIHMGRLWCKNIFQNLSLVKETNTINDIKTSKPVILIGAGESLEESLSYLKEKRDNLFIIAVDTSVRTLLSNSIPPDLIIILESQHANIYDFYDTRAFSIPVAADLTSSPEILRKFKGKKYLFLSKFDNCSIIDLLKRENLCPPIIPPLGSVGISGLYIASLISNSDVFYTGIDFAFTPDKYHANGSPTHISMMFNTKRTNPGGFFSVCWNGKRERITDKTGNHAYTDLVMKSYKETLNSLSDFKKNLFNIGFKGLETSIQLYDFCKLDEQIEKKQEIISTLEKLENPSPEYNNKKIKDFLTGQIDILNNTVEMIVNFINNQDSKKTQLLNNLNLINYTWIFFPDASITPSLNITFLKRVLFSASWFINIIENSIKMLDYSSDLSTDKKAF
ncbi:MAG: DUF115 domain-containing protein, partial [Spirochaetales bacterium]|nr:DUF115 domain-containing protein [Spirochaetales bacterium]